MKILEKIFPCLRKKQTANLGPIPQIVWTDQEVEVLEKIIVIRRVIPDNTLKHLADKRLLYQQTLGGISHDGFFGEAEPYKVEFKWKRIAELLAYKFYNPVDGFMRSESHKKFLIDSSLEYIGVAYDGERCVVILGGK